ncbi:stage VI sporulation protein F [Marinicrinis sediminis]|uniref:Stage VI sporulation protein F n=1 Tax=Marinicrinis sediminis TaxID=1652465 RepID=A0ABW5R5F3_9BACL
MPPVYERYGISKELVSKAKAKMKNPVVKKKVTTIVDGVTKQELQSPAKVKAMLSRISQAMCMKLTSQEQQAIVKFIIDQKIDPNNTFHLLKLWGMFR